MSTQVSRRQFLIGAATAAAAAAGLALPRGAFADDDAANAAAAPTGKIRIIHTNDVHCAAGTRGDDGSTPLGYAALASYAAAMKATLGSASVALVDAGDFVQGNVMGSITQGEAIPPFMNSCGYDFVIPGNHEFDYGMAQFDKLMSMLDAQVLSCNFRSLRLGTPQTVFSPYAIKTFGEDGGAQTRIAFIGVTTPATLTASSPKSFWTSDTDRTCAYSFCEDDDGSALVRCVQESVDDAKTAGADYVVLLAHLGQAGAPDTWRSDALVRRCRGIDVVIDGHSHQEYVQTVTDADGKSVIITQTGTQFTSVGQVTIDPAAGTITAATPSCEAVLLREATRENDPSYVEVATFGRSSSTQQLIDAAEADVEAQTGQVVGKSLHTLYAFEDDNYTWAVRSHETNLGDFVADALYYYAANAGVMPHVALMNGGGIRANIKPGDITKGDLINVQPFNNQICYTQVTGQDLLDALEVSVSSQPGSSGGFLQVSNGCTFTARTDIPTPCRFSGGGFAGIDETLERRVRDVSIDGKALDVNATYTVVSHSYYLIEGGNSYAMLCKNPVELLGLDNATLIEYVNTYLNGVIGDEYADRLGQGRIKLVTGDGQDPKPGADSGNGTSTGETVSTTTTVSTKKKRARGGLPDTDDTTGIASVVAAAGTAFVALSGVAGTESRR